MEEVAAATATALELARSGGGPTLIEAVTLVLGGGTITNEGREWRSEAEKAEWMAKDPIARLRARLVGASHLTRKRLTRSGPRLWSRPRPPACSCRRAPTRIRLGALLNVYYEGAAQ